MINLDIIRSSVGTQAKNFGKELKSQWKGFKQINKEYSIWNDVSQLKQDIKDSFKKGEVYTEKVTDSLAQQKLYTSKSGLASWAKSNGINITFSTPKKDEARSDMFIKPLNITISKNGLFHRGIASETIDGDTSKITKNVTSKTIVINKKETIVKSSHDETFLRRVYRALGELNKEL